MAVSNMTEFRCVVWRSPTTGAELKREFQFRTQTATLGASVGGMFSLGGLNGFTPWTPFPIVETTGSTDVIPT